MNPIPEDQLAAIREAIFRKQKIQAIKLYRAATGAQLVDAKDAVEKLETELRLSAPDKFGTVETRSGCFSLILGLTLVTGGIVWAKFHFW